MSSVHGPSFFLAPAINSGGFIDVATWDGEAWVMTQNSSSNAVVLRSAAGGWQAGLRPDRVRVTILRVGASPFLEVGFLWDDANSFYQWDSGSTYGYQDYVAGVSLYQHEAVIYEGGINSHLGDMTRLTLYTNGGDDVLFTGDKILNVEFSPFITLPFWTQEGGCRSF